MSQIRIQQGSQKLDVNIVIADCRCIGFHVNEDLSIDMIVPMGMSSSMVERYARMKEAEIFEAYEKKKIHNHQALPVTLDLEDGRTLYRSGQKLPYLGQMNMNLRIKLLAREKDTSLYEERLPDGERVLTIRTANDDQSFLRYCVMRYYRKCAGEIVRGKASLFGKRMQLTYNHIQITGERVSRRRRFAGLASRNIAIRNQTTLWGSCNSKRNLKFDWKLAMLPIEIIEYIIVHELAHLKKMNHSAAFWAEIEKIMPEYRECRAWLDKHGKEYEMF
ncbi:MAG: SprT family zinc-dependent metalloprotease [Eubacteriales bacterium]|nr:SprT family zinc-dependent metalloprotease [Eubacteriales bacterium]